MKGWRESILPTEYSMRKRCSPAMAYAALLFATRRKEAIMHPEPRGLWRDKWARRMNTTFEISVEEKK